MTDHYRISNDRPPVKAPGSGLRAALWTCLLVAGTANATTSALGFSPVLSVIFGLITVASIVALITHHRRHRGN
ncbi:hypothetical protein ACFCV3_12055 [Kribbella sp. NPDC056345]|uniref:hypothetical protein n=1 Tax=Kribbella sp. NPDC056345 TaxID=3345789 RepID=UPI0035D9D7F0